MRNIKALSGVIENVLLVLLVISAIVIVSFSVNKLVSDISYSPQLSCAELLLKEPIKMENVCYDGNDIKLILKKNDNTKINSLSFVIKNNEQAKSYSCADCGNCEILKQGIKTYYFNTNGEKIAVIINDCLIEEKEVKNC